MYGLIPIIIAITFGGLVLTFTSQAFADGISRYVEAALDAIEYRQALRAHRRAEKQTRVAGARVPEGFVRAASFSQAG